MFFYKNRKIARAALNKSQILNLFRTPKEMPVPQHKHPLLFHFIYLFAFESGGLWLPSL